VLLFFYKAGVITTKALLDYETMGVTNFVLDVTVTDTIVTRTSSVTITVMNVNEAPTFNAAVYKTNVPDREVSS